MDQQKQSIKKAQTIFKYSAIVILTLELIFFITEEIIDLKYSIYTEDPQSQYQQKKKLGLFRIIGNAIFYIFILVILFLNYYNALLMGGIIYLVFGLIAFLYLIIQTNTTAASESRPIDYYNDHISTVLNVFYILAGVMLLIGAGLILYYVKLLYDEKKIKEEEEKLMLARDIEGGDNKTIPLGTTFE